MIQLLTRRYSIVATVAALALAAGVAQADQNAETAQPEVKPYPLNVCIVTGAELGSMGDPVVLVHEGQEVKFCCSHCTPKFKENPEKYLKKLKEADKPATTQPAESVE